MVIKNKVESLRTIYRLEKDKLVNVRMSELNVGDIFIIDQLAGQWKVVKDPILEFNNIWEVIAYKISDERNIPC